MNLRPHDTLIREWLADPEAEVEVFDNLSKNWHKVENPSWLKIAQYRVIHHCPIVSSIPTITLLDLFDKQPNFNAGLRAIADTAAARAVKEFKESVK